MKLLVYCWGAVGEELFCQTLEALDAVYVKFACKMKDYHYDAELAKELIGVFHGENVEAVFSYDYFPLIAMLCEINKIPYISWIYDCPQYTLQSKTLLSPYNYIFCFDRNYTERLRAMGAVNCEHYPLAGDVEMLERATGNRSEDVCVYQCDISFIGSLYNEGRNRYRQAELSEYTKGWTEGIIEAQKLVYGYNFLVESLKRQTQILSEIKEKCQLQLGEEYLQDDVQLVADCLGMEVSARERELVLAALSEKHRVDLYTGSQVPKYLQRKELMCHGYVDHDTQLPLLYQNSRINLNITSKTIETGIPQRIFDIMSCGGFCITNYQQEIAEYFEEGSEIVMYYNIPDLLQKVNYYLEHEEERKRIAENGRKKVEECFSLQGRVKEMLHSVEAICIGEFEAAMQNEGNNFEHLSELKEYIKQCLVSQNVPQMIETLQSHTHLIKDDNDLANLYYLIPVYKKEADDGKVSVYRENMEQTLYIFHELQYQLRRLEWWEEYDVKEVFDFMIQHNISVYALQWAVETACVDKDEIWRKLRG